MARNPRPCAACGLPRDRCLVPTLYRGAARTQPLRARRQWAPSDRRIEIHIHVDPAAYTAEGKTALTRFLRDVRRAFA